MTVKIRSPKPVQQVQRTRVPGKENIIIRCIKVVIDDIRHKIYGATSEERKKWEDYERFCKIARGEK